MAKAIIYIVLQIIFLGCSMNVSYGLTVQGIWIPANINWESPNVEGLENIKYANISIMQFLIDGTFKKYNCTVYPLKDGVISISVPEDFVIFKGKWKKNNEKEILVTYRVIYRTIKVEAVGEKKDEDISELFLLDDVQGKMTRLDHSEKVFIKSDKFTEESKEFMNRESY